MHWEPNSSPNFGLTRVIFSTYSKIFCLSQVRFCLRGHSFSTYAIFGHFWPPPSPLYAIWRHCYYKLAFTAYSMDKPLPPPACVHTKCMPPTTHYMAPLWQSWKQNIQPLHSMQNWTWHPGAPDKLSQQEGLRNQYINQKSINQSICTHMQYIQITKILKRRQKTQMHQISFCCMKNLEINTSTSNKNMLWS